MNPVGEERERKRDVVALACIAAMPFLSSCNSDANQTVEHSTLHSGQFANSGTFTRKSSMVFVNQADYESTLGIYSNDAPESVDFSQYKVLLIDMGPRSNAGFSVAVSGVSGGSDMAVANVELSQHGDCATLDVLTNPYVFVKIRTQAELLLNERLVTIDCNS